MRYPGQPWAIPFRYAYVQAGRYERAVRVDPSPLVPLGPWRTDRRWACSACGRQWVDAAGSLARVRECPGCGSDYWTEAP